MLYRTLQLNFVSTYKFLLILDNSESRESTFGIATGYGLDEQGVGVQVPVV
jgi:hypothetical protein